MVRFTGLFLKFLNDNRNGASRELEESEDTGTDNNKATIDDNKYENGKHKKRRECILTITGEQICT
jgi:hypothetical protein